HRLSALMQQLQWTECPGVIEVVLQTILVDQAADDGWLWVLAIRLGRQEFAATTAIHVAPDSTEETLAVLPQQFRRGVPDASVKPRRSVHRGIMCAARGRNNSATAFAGRS